ncbi:MAG TPA: phosphate ABC transporter substrate-binding protein PstS [Acidimicrobiales bacterium]|nr:phosphate ABC transporter substrate-binding protein PstS [Acidimicrobiales bacterium]
MPLTLAVGAALALGACGSSSSTSSNTTTPSTAAASGSSSSTAPAGGGSTSVQTGNPAAPVTINETGSSLVAPYLAVLAAPLHAKYPNVTLASAAGGSGKGITDALSGTTQAGGTDAYLSNAQASQNPSFENIPVAVSSQSVDYNLPGVTGLKLTGGVLADVYTGKVTTWNDPEIAKLNPGVNLPATKIVPVHRSDSSGDTFLFTGYLTKTSPAWASGPNMNTTVSWPQVNGALTANGNPNMVQTCKSTPGCVAYVGISAQNLANQAGLGQAQLQNAAGQFLVPGPQTVTAAVQAGASSVPDNLAASLIDEPGAQSYPIVNLEYLVVNTKQSSPDMALALRDLFTFAIDPNGGASAALLQPEGFEAVPTQIVGKIDAALAKIQ